MEIGQKSRHGVYWGLCFKVVQQLFHFSIFFIIARLLSPKDFGVMAVSMAIVTYLNNLTGCGFTNALIQKSEITKEHVNAVFTLNLILSLIAFLSCWLLATRFAGILNTPELSLILPVLAFLIPISSFYNIPMALLRRNLEYKKHSIVEFFQYTIFSIILLLFALNGNGVWSLVYSSLTCYFLASLMLLLTNWNPRISFNYRSLRELSGFGIWDIIRYHCGYFDENAPYFIISKIGTATSTGFYERAVSLAFMPMRKIQIHINAVLFSAFSRMQDDNERITKAFNKSFMAVSCLILPVMVGLILLTPYIVHLLLGEKWTPIIKTFYILCVAAIFKSLAELLFGLNIAINRYKQQTVANILISVSYIVLLFFVVRNGIESVAWVTAIIAFSSFFYSAHITCKSIKIRYLDLFGNLVPAIFSTFIMFVSVKSIFFVFNIPINIMGMFIIIIVAIFIYYVAIILFPNQLLRHIIFELKNDLIIRFRKIT